MKKILLFLIILLLPITVKANYTITDYRMDITVLEEGDLNIIEAFKIEGEYNGIKRTVNYKKNFDGYRGDFIRSSNQQYDGTNVILNEVRAINFDYVSSFLELRENGDIFAKVSKSTKGSYGVYTVKETDNGKIFTIYNPNKMNKDFYIDYTIKDMVINHEDVAEIVLELFSDTEDIIDNLEIYIHIPGNEDMLNIWVHELNEQTQLIDSQTLKITATDVNTKNKPYFRMVFDNITEGKKSKEIVLYNIIDIESREIPIYKDEEYIKLQEEAYESVVNIEKYKDNSEYDKVLQNINNLDETDPLKIELLVRLLNVQPQIERITTLKKVTLTSLMGIWLIGLIIILYQMFKKYTINEDFEEIKYSKSLIHYLLKRTITPNDLTVTLLDLINKKIITLKKENNDFKIKKSKNNNLDEIEERALKFLFEDQNEILVSNLKQQCSKKYNHFLASYSNFANSTMKSIETNHFFEDTLLFKVIGIIYTIIGVVIGIILIDHDTYFSSMTIIIVALLFCVFFLLFYKRTNRGIIELKKYKNIKKQLNNYETIDLNNVEEDLIYAICLDCSNYINLLKIKLVEANKQESVSCNKKIEQQMMISDLVNYLIRNSLKVKKSM